MAANQPLQTPSSSVLNAGRPRGRFRSTTRPASNSSPPAGSQTIGLGNGYNRAIGRLRAHGTVYSGIRRPAPLAAIECDANNQPEGALSGLPVARSSHE